MKKVEEFNKTQMLMDEFKKVMDKGPKLDKKIEGINKKEESFEKEANLKIEEANLKIERSNLKIEKIQDEMNFVEKDINRNEVIKEYEKQIQEIKAEQDKEIEELNKQKEEISKQREEINKQREKINEQKEKAENEKKEFFTDERSQTITLEIKDMEKEISAGKLEIKKKEMELQQKDIELQEFYDKQEKENPLRWQEIYNEKDAIKKEIEEIKTNIGTFEKKIEEYSKFKQEIFDLKYPKITIELDEDMKVKAPNAKVEPTVDPTIVDPTKADPTKADSTIVDPTKADPTKADPTKADPTKADPTKVDPTKVDPTKVDPTKVGPTKVDLKDVKIIIGKKGLTIKAPGIDKGDEITLDLRELKDEADYWLNAKKEYYNYLFDKEVSSVVIDDMDPNIVAAMELISSSDLDSDVKKEIISRYVESVEKEGKVPEDKSTKGIIEYDRTGLDYLKPRNFISHIIHKEQFDDMKYFADIAEEMGIAEVKKDKPGWIRQLVSNMKNKVKLLGTGDLAKSEEYLNAKTQEEKDYLIASEKHRRRTKDRVSTHTSITEKNGKVEKTTYELKKDGKLKKVNPFKKSLHNEEASIESSKVHETQDNNTKTEQNTQEQEDEQTV